MRNMGLKAFSLFMAVMLFLFVNSESNVSVIGISVPIEIKNVPTGKMIILQSRKEAQVTIRGPSFLVSAIAASPHTFKIKIPPEIENRYVAKLRKDDLGLDSYVQVANIDPPEIELHFDSVVEREIPVVVPRIGALNDNLKIDEFQVVPDKIKVRGAQTELTGVARLETDPIDMREITKDTQRQLSIRSIGSFSDFSDSQVRVSLKVGVVMTQRRLTGLGIEVRGGTAKEYQLTPSVVNVELSGSREQINNLKREDIVPYARFNPDAKVPQELPISVDLPRGLVLVTLEPEKVKVSGVAAAEKQGKKK